MCKNTDQVWQNMKDVACLPQKICGFEIGGLIEKHKPQFSTNTLNCGLTNVAKYAAIQLIVG